MKNTFLLSSLFATLFISCAVQNKSAKAITTLKFIDEYSIPHKMNFEGTTVGGLSGIEYIPNEKVYYLISDDRSDINPLRYYTAMIDISRSGIDTVRFIKVNTLLQKNGQPYPSRKQNSFATPDPESIRYDAKNGLTVWSSEGERTIRNNQTILTNPSVIITDKNNRSLDTFLLPSNMHMKATQEGPRNNGVFEGLSFSSDFSKLYVSVEEPIYEDGRRAGLFDSSAWVRIISYDVGTKTPVAQYAYQIDPIVQLPISEGLFYVNGISEILVVNETQLLVVERSYSTGRLGNNIRVYSVDVTQAEDISNTRSLQKQPPVKPLQKTLLLNMDRLGRLIDNIEGITFGPRLPNGKRSLIFVSDDNFSPMQRTQFLLFEVN